MTATTVLPSTVRPSGPTVDAVAWDDPAVPHGHLGLLRGAQPRGGGVVPRHGVDRQALGPDGRREDGGGGHAETSEASTDVKKPSPSVPVRGPSAPSGP